MNQYFVCLRDKQYHCDQGLEAEWPVSSDHVLLFGEMAYGVICVLVPYLAEYCEGWSSVSR